MRQHELHPVLEAEVFVFHWLTTELHVAVVWRRLELISQRAKPEEPDSQTVKVTPRSPFITGKSGDLDSVLFKPP